MSKTLRKWNYEKHKYENVSIPDNWDCRMICDDMEQEINCCQCGVKIKFGEGYTSMEIHDNLGFAYTVCGSCREDERKEFERFEKKRCSAKECAE